MDFKILLYIQGFIVAIIFTIAIVLWYRINNENPTLYKCRHAINFILMLALVLVIKAFRIMPDPHSIRLILQHFLTTAIAIGFFFEIKKAYKKNWSRRKKELDQIMNLDVENPIKEELNREVIKPELKRLGGLRKLIQEENEKLEKKKEKLEEWDDKLGDLKDDLEIEKEKLTKLRKELKFRENELKDSEESLGTKEKKLEKKEKTHKKREQKLKEKRNEIQQINKKIEEEEKDIDKKMKTMKLLEEDVNDKKEDMVREQKKLEELKK
ncbi:MAG: hypothetical protein ISS23_03220 [Nanoarchaeota archaeon]|nr:hypothetical protein [Nanoarchaeota archaeon]